MMKYIKITYDDMLNGDGIRAVIWVSGCTHKCEGCHNPETWDFNEGLDFTDEERLQIFNYLQNDYVAGITFSGGDPLNKNNAPDVISLCKFLKTALPDKNIWVYTGYTYEDLKKDDLYNGLWDYIDVLVDGEFQIDKAEPNLEFRGSSNQKIIRFKR